MTTIPHSEVEKREYLIPISITCHIFKICSSIICCPKSFLLYETVIGQTTFAVPDSGKTKKKFYCRDGVRKHSYYQFLGLQFPKYVEHIVSSAGQYSIGITGHILLYQVVIN